MNATPKAVTWLNYRGDVTGDLWVGRLMGPNTLWEFLYVVDWVYAADQDRTRVGFSFVRPAELT